MWRLATACSTSAAAPEDQRCSSPGPGCAITGVDVNAHGISAGNELARAAGMAGRARFMQVNAGERLPFEDGTFDVIVCIDAINHLADRGSILRDWFRILRSGGRALYVDPIVVTGILTNAEIARRSAIGHFEFTPPGVNERLIHDVGFELAEHQDVTENVARVSKRWRDARARHRDVLVESEGEEQFEGLQLFFEMVHRLSSERRLSRQAFVVSKPS